MGFKKVGINYYNENLFKCLLVSGDKYFVELNNGVRIEIDSENYEEISGNLLEVNGVKYYNKALVASVKEVNGRYIVEFSNGNQFPITKTDFDAIVEDFYQIGDAYYNESVIAKVYSVGDEYFADLANGQKKALSESEYQAIIEGGSSGEIVAFKEGDVISEGAELIIDKSAVSTDDIDDWLENLQYNLMDGMMASLIDVGGEAGVLVAYNYSDFLGEPLYVIVCGSSVLYSSTAVAAGAMSPDSPALTYGWQDGIGDSILFDVFGTIVPNGINDTDPPFWNGVIFFFKAADGPAPTPGEKHDVIIGTLEGCDYTGDSQIDDNGSGEGALSARAGYNLPQQITINGETGKEGSSFGVTWSYDESKGVITFSNVTEDIYISANAEAINYSVSATVDNGTYVGPQEVTIFGTSAAINSAQDYYRPICITINEQTASSGSGAGLTWTYEPDTGAMTFADVDSNINLYATCTKLSPILPGNGVQMYKFDTSLYQDDGGSITNMITPVLSGMSYSENTGIVGLESSQFMSTSSGSGAFAAYRVSDGVDGYIYLIGTIAEQGQLPTFIWSDGVVSDHGVANAGWQSGVLDGNDCYTTSDMINYGEDLGAESMSWNGVIVGKSV